MRKPLIIIVAVVLLAATAVVIQLVIKKRAIADEDRRAALLEGKIAEIVSSLERVDSPLPSSIPEGFGPHLDDFARHLDDISIGIREPATRLSKALEDGDYVMSAEIAVDGFIASKNAGIECFEINEKLLGETSDALLQLADDPVQFSKKMGQLKRKLDDDKWEVDLFSRICDALANGQYLTAVRIYRTTLLGITACSPRESRSAVFEAVAQRFADAPSEPDSLLRDHLRNTLVKTYEEEYDSEIRRKMVDTLHEVGIDLP